VRKPHYLTHNKANQIPSNCLWFDTETRATLDDEGNEHHHLDFGYAAFRRRKQGLHWCKPDWLRFTTIKQFWDFAESYCRDNVRLTLFAHNGQFDLPVLHAFTELPRRGWTLKSAIVDAPPMIITWKRGRETIKFIDTLNIWRMSLAKIGESIGLAKLTMPDLDAAKDDWNKYGKRDTEIIMQACISWFDFIRKHDLGGFSPTLASQAFNAYRHRFMHENIFIDNKPEALELTRGAFFGGRTECFKIGTYTGDFYHLDINSMYPFVMAEHQYPVSLVGLYSRGTTRQLAKWLKQYAIVADVSLETDQPVYSMVHNGKLIFPVGRLRLKLSSPELRYALAHKHIKKIHLLAVYKQADLFSDFVTWGYRERQAARADNNLIAVWYIKIFLNSLFGKWGQRGRHYENYGSTDSEEIKVWTQINADTQEIKHFRQFGGIIQHWQDEGEAFNSFPAIAAHITAYARMALWGLMTQAGLKNVYYVDTDCVLVNKTGYNKLKGQIDASRLGDLKLEGHYSRIELHGAKDYVFDQVRRVKGVRHNAKWINDNTVEQVKFTGFRGLLRQGSLDAPIVSMQRKVLRRVYDKGIVLKSGKVKPLRFDLW